MPGQIDAFFKVTVQPVLAGNQNHHPFGDVPEITDLHIRDAYFAPYLPEAIQTVVFLI